MYNFFLNLVIFFHQKLTEVIASHNVRCTEGIHDSVNGEISQDGRRDFHRFSFRYQVTLQAFERRTNCPNSRFISWINNHRILDYLERNAHVARGNVHAFASYVSCTIGRGDDDDDDDDDDGAI